MSAYVKKTARGKDDIAILHTPDYKTVTNGPPSQRKLWGLNSVTRTAGLVIELPNDFWCRIIVRKTLQISIDMTQLFCTCVTED